MHFARSAALPQRRQATKATSFTGAQSKHPPSFFRWESYMTLVVALKLIFCFRTHQLISGSFESRSGDLGESAEISINSSLSSLAVSSTGNVFASFWALCRAMARIRPSTGIQVTAKSHMPHKKPLSIEQLVAAGVRCPLSMSRSLSALLALSLFQQF